MNSLEQWKKARESGRERECKIEEREVDQGLRVLAGEE